MTTKTSRSTFKKLDKLCTAMENAIAAEDFDAMSDAWDEANGITIGSRMSEYENAIVYAFDEFDNYMIQCEYMDEHRDEWSFDRFRIEQRDREKFAHATCAQQDLIRRIYGVDEETVHDDLMAYRRYVGLFLKVANLAMRHARKAS